MSELTLEERTAHDVLHEYLLETISEPDVVMPMAKEWVRAAVAAQREKDAKTNPADIACPNKSCHQEKHFPCISHNTGLIPCHPERWQAAIRAGGDDE